MRSELDRVCDRIGLRAEGVIDDPPAWADDDWASSATWWKVELRLGRRRLTVPFGMGSALEREPTPADVISSLVLDTSAGEQSFEEFCSEFGYDQDSRRAERVWSQCASMAPKVRRFLGDRFEEVSEAEH